MIPLLALVVSLLALALVVLLYTLRGNPPDPFWTALLAIIYFVTTIALVLVTLTWNALIFLLIAIPFSASFFSNLVLSIKLILRY